MEVLGHFSHVYLQGTSLYMILLGKVEDDAAAEERLMQIWDVAMNTCLERGAAISHHHGVGLTTLHLQGAGDEQARSATDQGGARSRRRPQPREVWSESRAMK